MTDGRQRTDRQYVTQTKEDTSQIHGDDPVEFGLVIAFDRTKLAFDTGIIEKGVDAPATLEFMFGIMTPSFP
jgi:hypothetical protein